MSEMVTYSVLANVFGSIATGQEAQAEARRKARADAAKRQAELEDNITLKKVQAGIDITKSQVDLWGNTLTGDARAALAFTTLPEFADSRVFMQESYPMMYAAVEAAATKDLGLSKIEESYYETAKSGLPQAINVLRSNYVQALPENDSFRQLIEARVYTPGLSTDQLNVLKDISYEEAQTILGGMRGFDQDFDIVNDKDLFSAGSMHPDYAFYRALKSIKKPVDEYETVLTTDVRQMIDRGVQGENVADALSKIKGIIGAINPKFLDPKSESYSPQATADKSVLEFVVAASATREPSSVEKALEVIESARTSVQGFTGAEAQKASARAAVGQIELEFNPETLANPRVAVALQSLKGVAEAVNKVADGTATFVDDNSEQLVQIKNFEDLFSGDIKKVDGALKRINGNRNIIAAYDKMDSNSKERFESGIKAAIQFVYDDQTKPEAINDGQKVVKIQRAPKRFNTYTNNLYELDFVSKYIHGATDEGGLNIPEYGTTRSGNPLLPPQGDLPPNVILNMSNLEVPLTEDTMAFASKRGFNRPSDMIAGNDVYGQAFNTGGNKLFTGMNLIHDSGAFAYEGAVDGRVYDDLAFGMSRVGIRGGRELMLTVAGNMSDEVPPELRPTGSRGVNAAKVRTVLSRETGMNIDLEQTSTTINNNITFAKNLREAISRAEAMGGGSKFEDGFRSAYFNIIGSEQSILSRAAGSLANFVRLEDMQNVDDYGVSNEQNRRGVTAKAKAFLEDEWATRNAELASLYVTLAYDFAKTMDPSGRISERDFSAALEAISGSAFAPRLITVNLMKSFLERAVQNTFFQEDVYSITSKFMGDSVVYMPTPGDMQKLRALKHYRAIDDRMQDQMKVELFMSRMDAASRWNSQAMMEYYSYSTPNNLPAELVSNRDVNIKEVRMKVGASGVETAPLFMGKPVYVDVSSGRAVMLSVAQMREYGLRS